MAMTQQEFFSRAQLKTGSINQSSLARKIGIGRSSLSMFKSGTARPSEETMLKIAKLTGDDPVEVIILWNLWRCNDDARAVYETLLSRVSKTLATCFLCVIMSNFAPPHRPIRKSLKINHLHKFHTG